MSSPRSRFLAASTIPLVLGACGSPTTQPTTTTVAPTTTLASVDTDPPSVANGACGTTSNAGPVVPITWHTKTYGRVAVTALFDTSGSLCGARAAWDTDLGLSNIITSGAYPKLDAAVAAAESVKVHGISGATAASNAYFASLQAAIDSE